MTRHEALKLEISVQGNGAYARADAMSAVDISPEIALWEATHTAATHTVVSTVLHRLGPMRDADQILVLGCGRTVERVPERRLLARLGSTTRPWARQSEGLAFQPQADADQQQRYP